MTFAKERPMSRPDQSDPQPLRPLAERQERDYFESKLNDWLAGHYEYRAKYEEAIAALRKKHGLRPDQRLVDYMSPKGHPSSDIDPELAAALAHFFESIGLLLLGEVEFEQVFPPSAPICPPPKPRESWLRRTWRRVKP